MQTYFSRYAYIEIALYGKSYITAAKDTFRLFRDRGIDAIVNDSLVSMSECQVWSKIISGMLSLTSSALTWGAYIVGLLSSLLGYIYLRCDYFSLFSFAWLFTISCDSDSPRLQL